MLEIDTSEFSTAAADIDDIADGVRQFRRHAGQGSHKQVIREQADEELRQTLLPSVKRAAARFVGDHSEDIHGVTIEWRGNTYSIGVGTDSVVVQSHEYGSGVHAGESARSDGTANGYRISARGDEPLAFSTSGGNVVTEFVIHPGVEGKQFMKETTEEQADDILRSIHESVVDELKDIVRT